MNRTAFVIVTAGLALATLGPARAAEPAGKAPAPRLLGTPPAPASAPAAAPPSAAPKKAEKSDAGKPAHARKRTSARGGDDDLDDLEVERLRARPGPR